MAISERERTERDEQSRRRNEFTGIQNVATYHAPGILAAVRGRPVRIVATGDAPGHSPVVQYVDEDGQLNWEEQDRVQIVDSAFLPPSQETLRHLMRAFSR